MEFNIYNLDNGIRCIHKQVSSPVASCAMIINAGSRDEQKNEYGIAHLIEHSLFKGTTHRKAYQINSRLENLGGELNAYTSKEETVIHATALRKDIRRAAELISDIVFNSTFPEHHLQKEIQVIIDEINSYKDMPAERIYDDFEDLLFKGSSLGHNILGSKKQLLRYNRDNILSFMNRTYNTDQMVFVVIGNLSEKRFRAICDDYLKDIAPSLRSFSRTQTQEYVPFQIAKHHGGHQTNCIIGTRAYNLHDPRRAILGLLSNMVGGPLANSLLNVAVREKKGLSYTIESNYTPYSDTGIFSIYFSCENHNKDYCLELINKELSKIANGQISPRKIAMFKRQYLGQLIIGMENRENYMFSSARSYLIYNKIDSMDSIQNRIVNISVDDITEVAHDLFTNDMSILTFE